MKWRISQDKRNSIALASFARGCVLRRRGNNIALSAINFGISSRSASTRRICVLRVRATMFEVRDKERRRNFLCRARYTAISAKARPWRYPILLSRHFRIMAPWPFAQRFSQLIWRMTTVVTIAVYSRASTSNWWSPQGSNDPFLIARLRSSWRGLPSSPRARTQHFSH